MSRCFLYYLEMVKSQPKGPRDIDGLPTYHISLFTNQFVQVMEDIIQLVYPCLNFLNFGFTLCDHTLLEGGCR